VNRKRRFAELERLADRRNLLGDMRGRAVMREEQLTRALDSQLFFILFAQAEVNQIVDF
jgi:hypothetical protein